MAFPSRAARFFQTAGERYRRGNMTVFLSPWAQHWLHVSERSRGHLTFNTLCFLVPILHAGYHHEAYPTERDEDDNMDPRSLKERRACREGFGEIMGLIKSL